MKYETFMKFLSGISTQILGGNIFISRNIFSDENAARTVKNQPKVEKSLMNIRKLTLR